MISAALAWGLFRSSRSTIVSQPPPPTKSVRNSKKVNKLPIWTRRSNKHPFNFLLKCFRSQPGYVALLPEVKFEYKTGFGKDATVLENCKDMYLESQDTSNENSRKILVVKHSNDKLFTVFIDDIKKVALSKPPKIYKEEPPGCFTGSAEATKLDGTSVKLQDIRVGDLIKTDIGFKPVANVTVSKYDGTVYQTANGLIGTPYHPVIDPLTGKWVFMKDLSEVQRDDNFNGSVYSVQFQKIWRKA